MPAHLRALTTTRRGLLGAGAVAAGALAFVGCTDSEPADNGIAAKVGTTPIPAVDDPAKALATAVTKERAILAQYDAALPTLPPAVMALATQARQDHAAHLDRLTAALAELGGTAPAPSASAATTPSPGGAAVGALAKAEEALVTADYQLAAGLASADLCQLVSSIMASEAQHAAVLDLAAGQAPVPSPFTGS